MFYRSIWSTKYHVKLFFKLTDTILSGADILTIFIVIIVHVVVVKP